MNFCELSQLCIQLCRQIPQDLVHHGGNILFCEGLVIGSQGQVEGDGFLYNMVRIFVGTLIDVAYGKLEPEDIPKIIEQKDRRAAGSTAPPHGLYLNKVEY